MTLNIDWVWFHWYLCSCYVITRFCIITYLIWVWQYLKRPIKLILSNYVIKSIKSISNNVIIFYKKCTRYKDRVNIFPFCVPIHESVNHRFKSTFITNIISLSHCFPFNSFTQVSERSNVISVEPARWTPDTEKKIKLFSKHNPHTTS